MIRVLIVDDNPVIRQGLTSLLATCDGIEVVGEAADGRTAVEVAEVSRPDVVLLDVRMPGGDGLTAAAALHTRCPVLMITYADDDDVVAAAVRAGASGYLVHGRFEVDELERSVREVAAGQIVLSRPAAGALYRAVRDGGTVTEDPAAASWLSERERDVMRLLVRGLSNREVADRLYLSEKTVKNHINRIFAKLGVRTRAEAIAAWLGTVEGETQAS